MEVDNVQQAQGIYGVDQDGRCWHCQSSMPHQTSPCDWPVGSMLQMPTTRSQGGTKLPGTTSSNENQHEQYEQYESEAKMGRRRLGLEVGRSISGIEGFILPGRGSLSRFSHGLR